MCEVLYRIDGSNYTVEVDIAKTGDWLENTNKAMTTRVTYETEQRCSIVQGKEFGMLYVGQDPMV